MNGDFDNMIGVVPTNWVPKSSTIKVIGVGGGGCNAVDYMFRQNIEGCIFIVCNTDSQALGNCSVPVKIQDSEPGVTRWQDETRLSSPKKKSRTKSSPTRRTCCS